ncbi:MATH and LRR domain-containing protein PFE0570w-like [Vespula squamosa]|uniref:MATH and LRR domain-containing protein PFE0570w-like n=1 Tax=Vespula squamosa TaxID=30214 RepID=A0ABD1ZVG0_VESSQ
MLKVFKLINILILILSIFFQLISSKPFIQSLNISKINKEPNFRHSSNDEEQMAIMFNQTLDYFIPRRRLLDNQYHNNYSKGEIIRPFNISINYYKNNLNLSVTPAWRIDLLPNVTNVPVNAEYISSTSFVEIEYDTTHVRRKRNTAVDDNQSKPDEEHESAENTDKKRSSSSSLSDNDEDGSDQRSNLQKSENDESEDYNADLEESNDTETDDDQDKVVQSKDTKMKRESSDYEYVEDQDKSSGDVRVKREETNQTDEKIKLEESNKNVDESAEKTDKIDEKVNETDSKRDATEEKNIDTVESPKLTKEDDSEYEKRVEEKIKRKIDSIKEEIKREIERKRRDREIERNNARFDELQSKDNDEQEEQEAVSANVDEKMASKRSSDDVKPKIVRRRRRRRRRRRSNESERIRHRLEEIEGVDNLKDEDEYRAAVHESIRKRFAPDDTSEQDEPKANRISLKAPIKKREKIRQMYVVKSDNEKKRKKKRKRRVADEEHVLVPEQAHVKIEDDLPRDLTFDPKLQRSQPVDEKVRIKRANARLVTLEYRPQNIEDEENDEGNEFGDDGFEDRTSNLKDRIGNSLIEDQEDKENQHSQSDLRALASSAKDSNRRLITDYNEAFGGLQSLQDNPNGALSRFKRIKRVLKTSRISHKNKRSN